MVKLNYYVRILPMINNNTTIQNRSKDFAIRIIKAYTQINKKGGYDDAAKVLSKQFLRSGTSIGANCKEAISAQSRKDFIHKYGIALKEARETEYWIEIMIDTEIVPRQKFSLLLKEIDEIIRTLVTIIKSLKSDL
jgi:four helix bundle protein